MFLPHLWKCRNARVGKSYRVVHLWAVQNHLAWQSGELGRNISYTCQGVSMSAQSKRCFFPSCNFSVDESSYSHLNIFENLFVICSKSLLKENPETRTWVQLVYLGGDIRKHSQKEGRMRQREKKSVKFALLNWFTLWTTRAQSHQGPAEENKEKLSIE